MRLQKGAAMVEFAIIALLFFMVLFAAIETGRWMFNWNTLVEATRRGARIATVCPLGHPYIKVATVFGDTAFPNAAQNSPILNGLSTSQVSITYYKIVETSTGSGIGDYLNNPVCSSNLAIAPACSSISAINASYIKLVAVSISYNHRFIAPVIGGILGNIIAPTFSTLMPVESLDSVLQKSPNLCYP